MTYRLRINYLNGVDIIECYAELGDYGEFKTYEEASIAQDRLLNDLILD